MKKNTYQGNSVSFPQKITNFNGNSTFIKEKIQQK